MARLASRFLSFFSHHRELQQQLELMLGFRPKHLPYYRLAFTHRSSSQEPGECNERLEFLGDAILGAVIAEYLFKRYPYQSEGFLTELRSRMVRRESLNEVAVKMGLKTLIQFNKQDRGLKSSNIFGNALEALIGAVYLDQGYARTRRFILQMIVKNYLDMDTLEHTDTNYKNQLLNWAQKGARNLNFKDLEPRTAGNRKIFAVAIILDGETLATGTGYSKKEASQNGCKKAMEQLGIQKERTEGLKD